ncbi:cyanophycin synthetase [Hymenobacter negativus]|uniref:Cyanophycin synthetase n=1 Tax=Hymenobacter negativus TaxID=2795026 RepID=A0ABS0Q6Y3_9BACT|nr:MULTISPECIES: cyanophycin synthetase [Bacteria]MBH8558409.1 cyanophycin synthetase [Hymenobacter negativus]MBH8568899.1 cyanophycin synthetase [Hymenobacter negativus]MBR7208634.1 cyanophycin synthetase [Microvirga sp. STS02]
MKIVDLRTMRGPSYWSVKHHKLIVAKVDLQEFAGQWSNAVPGFAGRLMKLFPNIETVQPGGMSGKQAAKHQPLTLEALNDGEPLGYVIQHVALELQRQAAMPVYWGKSYPAHEEGVEYVVFDYQEERAGRRAMEAAVEIVEALCKKEKVDIRPIITELHEIREDEFFGPSTYSIVAEAASRNIPYIQLKNSNIIQLGYGVNQRRIWATTTSLTSHAGVEVAGNKNRTKAMLNDAGVPVPRGTTVYSEAGLRDAIDELGFPIVTKPLDGNHGKGATIRIMNWKDAAEGLKAAQVYSRAVIVEQFIEGFDFRLLVVNGKLIAAAKRTPAAVTGNGKSTIQQLIDEVNKDPRRGIGHEKVLTSIKADKHTLDILKARKLSLKSVLPAGEEIYLKSTANISTGGTATDVTDQMHPYNVLLAERVAGIVGLDICGIDLMATDIAVPLNESRGAVIEVNAAPGFRMHISPAEGLPRNVAAPVVDMLFPRGSTARIPIIAVTGTNGKTTTTRLIAHLVASKGYKVGFTTTDGIYIQGVQLQKGDCTGGQSAEFVLKDPTVNYAVLETARGGMLRSGLGFHTCDIAVVTNVAADHLGLRDIYTVEEMAAVKGVLPRTVRKNGWAVLNADDDLVYAMARTVDCRVALFSMDEKNPRILEHVEAGGVAAVYEEGYVTIYRNSYKLRIDRAAEFPVTFEGRAGFNIENCLAAGLAGYLAGFESDDIKTAFRTFVPSATKTPGRMNIYKFPKFDVVVDYAHNTAGITKFAEFMDATPATRKIGIVSGLGDRRDEDTLGFARIAGRIFDEVILRQDRDLRGKSAEFLKEIMERGLRLDKPDLKITYIEKEPDAIDHVLKTAPQGAVITMFAENIAATIAKLDEFEKTSAVG